MWIEHHYQIFQPFRLRSMYQLYCIIFCDQATFKAPSQQEIKQNVLEEDFCFPSAGLLTLRSMSLAEGLQHFWWGDGSDLRIRDIWEVCSWHYTRCSGTAAFQNTLQWHRRMNSKAFRILAILKIDNSVLWHEWHTFHWCQGPRCIGTTAGRRPFFGCHHFSLGCQVVVTHTFVTFQESGGCVVDFHSSSILDAVSSELTGEIV